MNQDDFEQQVKTWAVQARHMRAYDRHMRTTPITRDIVTLWRNEHWGDHGSGPLAPTLTAAGWQPEQMTVAEQADAYQRYIQTYAVLVARALADVHATVHVNPPPPKPDPVRTARRPRPPRRQPTRHAEPGDVLTLGEVVELPVGAQVRWHRDFSPSGVKTHTARGWVPPLPPTKDRRVWVVVDPGHGSDGV